MVVLRALGWLLVLAAAVIGVYEIAEYIDNGDPSLTTLGELWLKVHASSLNAMQAFVQRELHEDIWTSTIQPVLVQPALYLFGGTALFCLVVGYIFRRSAEEATGPRRRRRRR